MAPSDISKMAARKLQDHEFYTLAFPKDHVEFMVYCLQNMAKFDNNWSWPGKIDHGMKVAIAKMHDRFKRLYTVDEVLAALIKLFQRYCVMSWMTKETELAWTPEENKFYGDNDTWNAVVQEYERALWYFIVGDPFWPELALIFKGTKFAYVSDSEPEKSDSESQGPPPPIVFQFGAGLQSVNVGEGPSDPSPATKAKAYRKVTMPNSPGNWNLGVGSPSHLNPLRFAASPSDNSSGVKEIGEEEWEKSRLKSDFQTQAKRILQWHEHNKSPGGSSSGSSPEIRAPPVARHFQLKEIKKEK